MNYSQLYSGINNPFPTMLDEEPGFYDLMADYKLWEDYLELQELAQQKAKNNAMINGIVGAVSGIGKMAYNYYQLQKNIDTTTDPQFKIGGRITYFR